MPNIRESARALSHSFQDARIAVASSNGLTFVPQLQLIALASNILTLGNQVESEETATLPN
jgi:hypothetical protein